MNVEVAAVEREAYEQHPPGAARDAWVGGGDEGDGGGGGVKSGHTSPAYPGNGLFPAGHDCGASSSTSVRNRGLGLSCKVSYSTSAYRSYTRSASC